MSASDPNRCGNPRIDALAARGRLASVWDRLAHKYPMVRAHAEEIWLARRSGAVARLVERCSRYSCLLKHADVGPQSEAEWVLLATAALEAIGKEPCEGELGRADGLWVGQSATHPAVIARHAGCERCAAGAVPGPIQGYPLAH